MHYRINTGGIAEKSIRSYYGIKKRMSKIIKAKMEDGKREAQYELTLFDTDRHFEDCIRHRDCEGYEV